MTDDGRQMKQLLIKSFCGCFAGPGKYAANYPCPDKPEPKRLFFAIFWQDFTT
jgi:hypothetical protein